jgi:nitric oxide reductase NorE protein
MTNLASATRGITGGDLRSGTEVQTRATPGQPDMWVLVMIEALTFTAYFVVYIVCWALHPRLYSQSQAHLSLMLGVSNTLMLVTSSWSMARCVQQARARNYGGALWNVIFTILLGLVYFIAKLYEWSTIIHNEYYFSTNQFFSFYYFLTGMHLLHVIVGFIVLGVVIYQLSSPIRRSQEIIETGATYWHMVDFLWIFIFALLYVMR